MSKPAAAPVFVRHELMTTDAEAAAAFYGKLWGWQAEAEELPDGQTYTHLALAGKGELGGLYAMTEDLRRGRVAPHWCPMLGVGDAEALLGRAKGLGARVITDVFDLLGKGRMALLQDPTGAPFGLWQGAAAEAGSAAIWHELTTGEGDAAVRFYSELLGWEAHSGDRGSLRYTTFTANGQTIGGMLVLDDRFRSIPAHWLSYFKAPGDVAGASAAVVQAGGRILAPDQAVSGLGHQAVVQDPQGATFGLMAAETLH